MLSTSSLHETIFVGGRVRIWGHRAALIIGVIAFSAGTFGARPAFAVLDRCGEYVVTGNLHCENAACSITVFPKSRSETTISLISTPKIYNVYNDSTVQVRIHLMQIGHPDSLSRIAKVLDPVPLRALENPSRSAVQLKKSSPCHS